ncbi:MAG: alcohol dehydrogenase catalytic domain-containing protein [Oscillospiraceae bacterium]|nr:alcohol dehydrogenase catalytic domain-containing protein [Oscillospiraceae bacterium]
MKALVFTKPQVLELRDAPAPVPAHGEALLKVLACAICGSDVHGWLGTNGRRTAPVVMGHELTAKVEALGDGCTGNLKVGDVVAIQPLIPCFDCAYCKKGMTNICPNRKVLGVLDTGGAMQDYITMPEKHCFVLPAGMSYKTGALAEPFAVSYCAVKKAGDLRGKNVLIVGGGVIGLLALMAAKLQNPKKIALSDMSEPRLEIAKKLGAQATINPGTGDFDEQITEVFGGEMADVTIEAVGIATTVNQALRATAPGGTSVWIGNNIKTIDVNMQDIVTREITVKGTYMFAHEAFGEVIEQFARLDVSALIDSEVPLENAPEMFKALFENPDKYLKCIINFAAGEE